MGTPLGPKYIPYTYMDPLGVEPQRETPSVSDGPAALFHGITLPQSSIQPHIRDLLKALHRKSYLCAAFFGIHHVALNPYLENPPYISLYIHIHIYIYPLYIPYIYPYIPLYIPVTPFKSPYRSLDIPI